MLVRTSNDSDAQMAFRCALVDQNDSMRWAPRQSCDGCSCRVSPATGRAVCRRCYDVDLCRDCFINHRDGSEKLSTCVEHTFLEIYGTSLLQETRKATWLEQLAQVFPRQGEQDEKAPGINR